MAYLIIALGVGLLFLLLFWLVINTSATSVNTSHTVDEIQGRLDNLQVNIESDHQRQDEADRRLLECLANLFIETTTATQEQVGECTRPVSSDTDTTPVNPINNPSIQNQSPSSQFQSIPDTPKAQPDNSQRPDNIRGRINRTLDSIGNTIRRVFNSIGNLL